MLGIQLCGGASNPAGRKRVSAGLLRRLKSSYMVKQVTLWEGNVYQQGYHET